MAAYIGGPVVQASWLAPKVGEYRTTLGACRPLAWSKGWWPPGVVLYSTHEPSELLHDDSTVNIVTVIIIITAISTQKAKCTTSEITGAQQWSHCSLAGDKRITG